MSITTDYDYRRYTQYGSMISSAAAQQSVQSKNLSDDTVQAADDSAQGSSAVERKSPLYSLIESGTITSDQEKAIKDAFETSRLAYQTQAGAANAFASSSANPLDNLVTNGTITEEQASAVKSTLESDKNVKRMPPPPPPPKSEDDEDNDSDPLSDTLDSLVSSGTITSEQKSSIVKALQEALETNKSQTEETDTAASNSTTAAAATSSVTAADPLDSLVSAGIITEDQKSAIDVNGKVGKMPPPPPPPEEDGDKLSSILESLKNDGKITEDQQQTILSALQSATNTDNKQTDTSTDSDTEYISALKTAFEAAIQAYGNQYSYEDDVSSNNFSTEL